MERDGQSRWEETDKCEMEDGQSGWKETDVSEMDRCDVFRGVTKKPRARRQAAVLLLRPGPQYG